MRLDSRLLPCHRPVLHCLGVVLLALASGCASSTVVASKGPRPPLKPEEVTIYQEPPKQYETHGTVSITEADGGKWDGSGNADRGFDSLKAKAAALGANGLLLTADPGSYDRLATAGYHGKFYQIPIRGKAPTGSAFAQAIFVLKE